MTEDGRDDHRVDPSPPKLGGDRVAHVVQPSGGMQPGLASEPLERAAEGVRVQGETISTIADHRERLAPLVYGVAPFGAKGRSSFQLFASVSPDAIEGEGRKLNLSACPLRLERRERDGACVVSTSDRLDASADEDRAGIEIDVRPGHAENLRAARPGDRGEQDRSLPDRALRSLQQGPHLDWVRPVHVRSSRLGALHGADWVGRDEPVLHCLAEGRAEDAPDLGDRGRGQAPVLHPGEDGADVAGPDLADLDPADDGDDVPADVALVPVQGSGADPSSTLVLEPAAQVIGEADPFGAEIASSFHVADELV